MMFWSMHSEDESPEGYRGIGGDIIELRVYRCEWFNMSDYWVITELMLTGEKKQGTEIQSPHCVQFCSLVIKLEHVGV